MGQLILLRHGQSEWNKKNIFTGWVDVPLSPEGIGEALAAGREIQKISIDVIFTSTLERAMMTAMLAMSQHLGGKVPVICPEGAREEKWGKCYNREAAQTLIPVYRAWELNERMYGELQGMNKQAMREKYGEAQVHKWRRSYDLAPPGGESLKMTAERTLPYFRGKIVPELKGDKTVFVSAHGNSLRSIVMELENLDPDAVVALEIPTGQPLFYRYENGHFLRHHN